MKFAAFIMTYNRPEILSATIQKIKNQSLSPSEILIVDNSENDETQTMVNKLNDPIVQYHKVGYNSGPAGAAGIGLKLLAERGFDWIYWGDDDDPPRHNKVFENLFNFEYPEDTGAIGEVGQYFNQYKAEIQRVTDKELLGTGLIEVHNIAGGMNKIVKASVIRDFNIFPEGKLFFGFEELDFDLKLRHNGFKLFCPKPIYYQRRNAAGRLNFKRSLSIKAKDLNRVYYSYRNLLYISFKNDMFFGTLYLILKILIKSLLGFASGFTFGVKNFKMHILALFHFMKGEYGKK